MGYYLPHGAEEGGRPKHINGFFSTSAMDSRSKYNPQIHHRRSIRLHGYDYSNPGLYFITICTHNREHRFGYITGAGIRAGVNPELSSTDNSFASIRAGVNPAPTIMVLNGFGQIANDEWVNLQSRFPNVELGEFVIMPNHMHGIISITDVTVNDEKPGYAIGNIIGAYKSLVSKRCLELHIQQSVGAGFTPALSNMDKSSASNREEASTESSSADISFASNRAGAESLNTDKSFASNRAGASTESSSADKSFASNRAGASPAPTMGKIWQRNYYEHIIRNEASYNKIADYIVNNPANWQVDKFYS